MGTQTQLTKDLMDQHRWQEVISKCTKKERRSYNSAFYAKANEAHEAGDPAARDVFALLGLVTAVAHKRDPGDTFPEDWLLEFTDEQVQLFKELALATVDAEMRARFADIVWERNHDPEMGRLAVDSHLESAKTLEEDKLLTQSTDRVERAMHVARLLGKKSKYFTRAKEHIVLAIDRHKDTPSIFLALMMELLQKHREGDSAAGFAAVAEKAANFMFAQKNWELGRRFIDIEAEWYFISKQPEAVRAARVRWIETYVTEAEVIVNTPNRAGPFNHASLKIERALKAYQDLGGPGTRERRAQLYKLLLEYQKKINEEFLPISPPVDDELEKFAAAMGEYAVNQVRGKSVVEAIVALAGLPLLPNIAQLREQVEDGVNKSPIALLFPSVMYSADGRVVARPSSGSQTRDEQVAEEVRARMFSSASLTRQFRVQAVLLPAISQVNNEHHLRVRDFVPFVMGNPFVPSGREALFTMGLHAGLTGNYVTAVHLLIPQIENSIRHVLTMHGEISSGFTRQEVQNHFDLNRVLNNDELEAVLINVLDEDLVFELKALLVHHYGVNLRNEIAHGTLGVPELNSAFYYQHSMYLFWLVLRLCLTNLMPTEEDSAAGGDEEAESAQDQAAGSESPS